VESYEGQPTRGQPSLEDSRSSGRMSGSLFTPVAASRGLLDGVLRRRLIDASVLRTELDACLGGAALALGVHRLSFVHT
jgi:hypothetical protein